MRAFRLVVMALAMCTAFAGQVQAQELSVNDARAVARSAMLQGNLPVADALSAALLARDPDDVEALLIRAALTRASGDPDASRDFAARAYGLAETDTQRYDAAMLAAEAEARREHFTRSQLWLRRADQVAPTDEASDLVARSYAQVAQRNPLKVQLSFSIAPSNNVNNGAETALIEIGDFDFYLDDSGLQLGGTEASAGLSFSYRLSEDKTQKTEVLGQLFGRKVWLDNDAKVQAPGVEGSDFDYGVVVAGLRHTRLIWPDTGPSQVTGVIGQSWYGGDEQARWGELQLGQIVARGKNAAWRISFVLREEERLDDPINSSTSLGTSTEYLRQQDSGASFGIGASLRTIESDSATVDSWLAGINGRYTFAPLGPVQPSVTASISRRDYRSWSTTPGGRQDDSLSLGLNLTWTDLSYYGFVPQVSVNGRRTWSNVDIYDRNQFSVGLTAVSRF